MSFLTIDDCVKLCKQKTDNELKEILAHETARYERMKETAAAMEAMNMILACQCEIVIRRTAEDIRKENQS